MPVTSQAVTAPLAEELATEEAAQSAGKRLEDHLTFLDV